MRKNQWPVTISIGVVTFTVSPLNSDELIGIVDNLMYRVKSSGKNSIRYEVLKR
jgi:GGDEF domain-containing protein